jgi:hypothetical protein
LGPFFKSRFFYAAEVIHFGVVPFFGLVSVRVKIFAGKIAAFGARVHAGVFDTLIHPAFHGMVFIL